MEVLSPCTYECHVIDDECISCKRTVPEIMNWTKLTDEQRKEIMDRCSQQKD